MKKMNEVVKSAIEMTSGVDAERVENYFCGSGKDEYLDERTTPEDCWNLQNAEAIFPNLNVGDITTIAELCSGEDWSLFYPILRTGGTTVHAASARHANDTQICKIGYVYKMAGNQPEGAAEIGDTKIEIVSIKSWQYVEDYYEIHVPPCC